MSKTIETLTFIPRHQRQVVRRVQRQANLSTPHPARIARLLALAHHIEAQIESGEFQDYAAVARAHNLTRARLTQIMNLLLLAPIIQEEILQLEALPGWEPVTERHLRPVLESLVWEEQIVAWRALLASRSNPDIVLRKRVEAL